MNEKRRIGIMGGTFDPVHMGHLMVAESAREKLRLDKVVFMPSGFPPHKEKSKVSEACHRFRMVELSIRDNCFFCASEMEIMRRGDTYTIDTLTQWKENFPEDEIFFITGADAMDLMVTWKDYERLFDYAKFVVAVRGDSKMYRLKPQHKGFEDRIIILDTPCIEISSTQIRQNVRDDISIRYMVSDAVREYIHENGLYLGTTD